MNQFWGEVMNNKILIALLILIQLSFAQLIPDNPIFYDDFETGDFSKWTNSNAAITICGNDSVKFGSNAIVYSIESVGSGYIRKDFLADYSELYVSFYFKLGPGFDCANSTDFRFGGFGDAYTDYSAMWYIGRSVAGELFIRIYRYSDDGNAFMDTYPIQINQWHWIKVRYLGAVSGIIQYWVDGCLVDTDNVDTHTRNDMSIINMCNFAFGDGQTGEIITDQIIVTQTDHQQPINKKELSFIKKLKFPTW